VRRANVWRRRTPALHYGREIVDPGCVASAFAGNGRMRAKMARHLRAAGTPARAACCVVAKMNRCINGMRLKCS
jgi:hypothetical protein